MVRDHSPQPRPISRARRLLFTALLLLLVWGTVELFSAVSLSVLEGSPFPFAQLADERALLLGTRDNENPSSRVRMAEHIFDEATFVSEPSDDASSSVTLTDDRRGIEMTPPPTGEGVTLRAPAAVGTHRINTTLSSKGSTETPIIFEFATRAPNGGEKVVFQWRLEPGIPTELDRSIEISKEGSELVLRARLDTDGLRGALQSPPTLLLAKLQDELKDAGDTSNEMPILRGSEVIHPFLGYSITPGYSIRDFGTGPVVSATQYGFFDDASPIHKRGDDRLIVGILGGSLAEMFSRLGSKALSERLAESDRFAGKEIIIVNAAIKGSKQPQQLMALNYLLILGAEFDAIINIDGFNELALGMTDNASTGTALAFPRKWPLRISTLSPEYRFQVGKIAYLEENRRSRSQLLENTFARHSPTAILLWRLSDKSLQRRITEAQVAMDNWSQGALSPGAVGPRSHYSDDDARLDALVRIWSRSSRAIQALSDGHGIRYFHLLQPNQYVPSTKKLTAEEQRIAYNPASKFRPHAEAGYPRLREAGRTLNAGGVSFHDLSWVFEDVQEEIYFDRCCHVNRVGNEIMASAIADYILENW